MNKIFPSSRYDSDLNSARINPDIKRKREEKLEIIEKTNISILINLEKRLDKITSAIRKLKNTIKYNKRKKACVICYEKLQRVILLPCQHSDFCNKCVKQFEEKHNNLCPLCRQEIETYIKL